MDPNQAARKENIIELDKHKSPYKPFDPLLECLLLVGKIYHRPLSAIAITAGLPVDTQGMLTPELFIRAAKRGGFAAKILSQPLDKLRPLSLPAILLLKDHSACILERLYPDGRAVILQPETPEGAQEIPLTELTSVYAGQAIFIRPQYHFRSTVTELHEETEKSQHWFWDVIKKMWPIYSEVLVASFLINLFILASPLFVMNVYDRVVPNHAVDTLWVLAFGVLIVFLFDFGMRLLRSYFIDSASKNVDTHLSASIFEQLLGAHMAFRPQSVGVLSHMVHSFESFRDFITSATVTVVIDLPFTAIFLVVVWLLGGYLVMVPLLEIPLVIAVGFLVQKPLNQLIQQNYKYSAEKQATLLESLGGIETVKSLSAESPFQRRWERVICQAAALSTKLHFLSNFSVNFSLFAQQLGSVIIVILGVYKIAENELTTGALIACTILTGRALAPMTQVAGLIARYQQSVTGLKSVDKLMKMPTERQHNKTPLEHPKLQGKIEFRQVSFHYPKQKLPALENLSFVIHPGERVGIIGRIGSGKTTIEKLILNLYHPTSGHILIDNIAQAQYDPTEIRRSVGYVPQDITLFNGSIRENIVFSAPYVDDRAIQRAADLSGVSQIVQTHPEGFDIQVGERGVCLSGGQRQAIAIARALLLDPPILLLDEPTNSMDDKTESLIKLNLSNAISGKTVILITHRGSMLSLVDRLIVIESGHLVADGPKEEILQALAEGKIKTPKL